MSDHDTFTLRAHQKAVHEGAKRFSAVVMHRRAGKSVYCVARLMSSASSAGPGGRFHYVGPSIKQTKAIAWAYAQALGRQLGCKLYQSELKVEFPHGATVELLGVENIDSLRGRYSDGCVLDEAQLMPTSHWTYVIRPLLADRQGWGLVTGTPAGKHNLLGWAVDRPDWFVMILRVQDTDALDPAEVESMRRDMSAEAWAQEMECSFTAALQGAYYARLMDAMAAEGRLTAVKYDPALPVVGAIDLGHHDLMPVHFAQELGTELRVIKRLAYEHTSIPDMVQSWKRDLPFWPDVLILPHDARVRELGSGLVRQEVFENLGVKTTLAPNLARDEGIEQVRRMLPRTWIDKDDALHVFEALGAYHAEYDEVRGVQRLQPVHDWASHDADAFRYLCVGNRATAAYGGDQPPLTMGVQI